jgi:serine/threonine protein kinase
MPDRIGQHLGAYRLVRLLGRGGFAEVYLGEHVHLGSQAAIKVLHAHLSQGEKEAFLTEARLIARLTHPQIVRVLDFGVEAGTPYLVMHYAPGGTLRARHPQGSVLAVETILPYVRQVAEALQYAHAQKLIHRDVKPENILLGEQGRVLLSDFGIATIAHSSRSQQAQDVAGTVHYMAPEQVQGFPRPASDQYALGIVVYEWLTGTRPFEGTLTEVASQHLLAPPRPLRERVPTVSPLVEQVVLRALAKDSHARFASVAAFATALEQAARGQVPAFPPALPAAPAASPSGPVQAQPIGSPGVAGQTAPPTAAPPKRRALRRLLVRGLTSVLAVVIVLASLGAYLSLRGRASASQGANSSHTGPVFHEVSLLPGDLAPNSIAILKDGTVFFADAPLNVNSAGGAIGRITPAGKVSTIYQFTTAGIPENLTLGPDGNLWFDVIIPQIPYIERIAPNGANPTPFYGEDTQEGFVAGSDGNLWFIANGSTPQIGRLTPQGGVTYFNPLHPLAAATLEAMTLGPNPAASGTQALWFATQQPPYIGSMSFAGSTGAVYPLPSDAAFPEALAYNPKDGHLWLMLASNQLGRISPSRSSSFVAFPLPAAWVDTSGSGGRGPGVFSIVADARGNLWFTNPAGNQIGRATPQGQVTLFTAPNGRDLMAAPDGSLWYVETGANKLVHITLS